MQTLLCAVATTKSCHRAGRIISIVPGLGGVKLYYVFYELSTVTLGGQWGLVHCPLVIILS